MRISPSLSEHPMRLADFIVANSEPILQKWEIFAGTILPHAKLSSNELRDHAQQMLNEIVVDLHSSQTDAEQASKAEGLAPPDEEDKAAETHAETRLDSGFTMDQMVSEYRGLRASVLLLWSQELETGIEFELQDIMRFNECIDQLLAASVARYSRSVAQTNNLFLGILAHDLRTPLHAIGIGAEIMLRSDEINGRHTKISTRIFNSAKRAGKIVENLLDFTRANTSAGLEVRLGKGNLEKVCEGIVEEVRIHHPDRTIVFEVSGDFIGNFDTGRIEQAVCNLVENAVVHGAAESVVTVKLRTEAEHAVLSVHNDGVPIAARDIPHIFDPLTRYSQHAADERGSSAGLGLGLYITNQIIAAHQGEIRVDSTPENGTTFLVKLPLATQQVLATSSQPNAA